MVVLEGFASQNGLCTGWIPQVVLVEMSLVAATKLRWPPVHRMLSHRESAMMVEAQWSGLDTAASYGTMAIRTSFVECTCRCVHGGHVFLHVRICTSHVPHPIYWREEKAKKNRYIRYILRFHLSMYHAFRFEWCQLCWLNDVWFLSFLCNTFAVAIHDLHGFPSFGLYLTFGRGSLIRCFFGGESWCNQTGGWPLGWWWMFWYYFPIEWEAQTSDIP